MRLPEIQAGRRPLLFLQTMFVRKIKSNIENILQILWEREADQKKAKAAAMGEFVFTADQTGGPDVFAEGDENEATQAAREPVLETLNLQVAGDPGPRQRNEERRQALHEKAPKIVRLQSKVCKIMSDHEDVREYDDREYPPGTEKISKFLTLDVEQEKLQKERTAYKSYAEI